MDHGPDDPRRAADESQPVDRLGCPELETEELPVRVDEPRVPDFPGTIFVARYACHAPVRILHDGDRPAGVPSAVVRWIRGDQVFTYHGTILTRGHTAEQACR